MLSMLRMPCALRTSTSVLNDMPSRILLYTLILEKMTTDVLHWRARHLSQVLMLTCLHCGSQAHDHLLN